MQTAENFSCSIYRAYKRRCSRSSRRVRPACRPTAISLSVGYTLVGSLSKSGVRSDRYFFVAQRDDRSIYEVLEWKSTRVDKCIPWCDHGKRYRKHSHFANLLRNVYDCPKRPFRTFLRFYFKKMVQHGRSFIRFVSRKTGFPLIAREIFFILVPHRSSPCYSGTRRLSRAFEIHALLQ